MGLGLGYAIVALGSYRLCLRIALRRCYCYYSTRQQYFVICAMSSDVMIRHAPGTGHACQSLTIVVSCTSSIYKRHGACLTFPLCS
jgi:hypothetical protein